jgi:hypothetical protein
MLYARGTKGKKKIFNMVTEINEIRGINYDQDSKVCHITSVSFSGLDITFFSSTHS